MVRVPVEFAALNANISDPAEPYPWNTQSHRSGDTTRSAVMKTR
jgi:hypothetical protein